MHFKTIEPVKGEFEARGQCFVPQEHDTGSLWLAESHQHTTYNSILHPCHACGTKAFLDGRGLNINHVLRPHSFIKNFHEWKVNDDLYKIVNCPNCDAYFYIGCRENEVSTSRYVFQLHTVLALEKNP